MLKKFVLPIGILLSGLGVISFLVIAKPKPTPQPPPEEPANVTVAVAEVFPQTMRLAVTTQGTVEPKREIDLVAQVSGQIISVAPAFVNGGFFTQQQVLIQIDDRDYKVAVLNAKARLAEAQTRLAEEEGLGRQVKREWRDLGNESANDLFMRKPQLAAAIANLASAQGDLEMAQLNLERTQIKVPFDGRVKQIHADLGQFVSVGTRLAAVYDATVLEVRLPLTEKQAALVHLPLTPNPPAERSPEDHPAVMINGSVAGVAHQWQGHLARTDAFVDANSRTYYAIVEVPNTFPASTPDGSPSIPLLPGLFVEATIEGKDLTNVIRLPRSALFQRDQILSLDSERRIVNHTVNVLRKSETQIWVQAPLQEKTLVTLEKQSLTPAGTTVTPFLAGDQAMPSERAEASLSSNNTTLTTTQQKD